MNSLQSTAFLDIIVANTSPSLYYEGDWTTQNDSTSTFGSMVAVPEGKKGSLSYNFTGVHRVIVQGIWRGVGSPIHSMNSPADPYIIAFDIFPLEPRVSIDAFPDAMYTASGWADGYYNLFDVQNLSPATSYTLKFTLESLLGTPIWFDALLLTPVPATNLDTALVDMHHDHPMVQYDINWYNQGNFVHITNTTGSTMKLDFNGTSLKWYTGWNAARDIMNISSEASWRVDGMESQKFTIPTPDPVKINRTFRSLLFEILDLSPGLHHLEVTHHGDKSSQPLTLTDLVIQSALAASPSPPTLSNGTFPATPSPSSVNRGGARGLTQGAKAAIGVSTSLIVVVFIGAFFIMFHLHKRDTARLKKDVRGESDGGSPHTPPAQYVSNDSPTLPPRESSSKGTPVLPLAFTYPHEPVSSQPPLSSKGATDMPSQINNHDYPPPAYGTLQPPRPSYTSR